MTLSPQQKQIKITYNKKSKTKSNQNFNKPMPLMNFHAHLKTVSNNKNSYIGYMFIILSCRLTCHQFDYS